MTISNVLRNAIAEIQRHQDAGDCSEGTEPMLLVVKRVMAATRLTLDIGCHEDEQHQAAASEIRQQIERINLIDLKQAVRRWQAAIPKDDELRAWFPADDRAT